MQPRAHQIGISLALLTALALAAMLIRNRINPAASPPLFERTWPVMGTFMTLSISGNAVEQADQIHRQTQQILQDLNQRLSVYHADSEISQLNRSAVPVHISEPTQSILRLIQEYVDKTDGAFDPTILPLIKLWGFSGGEHPAEIPTAAMIAQAQGNTGIDKLQLQPGTAGFTEPGISIDLGAIAKGYAVDRCYAAIVAAYPAADIIFNLGGDIRIHGQATAARPWRIGVKHPFDKTRIIGALQLSSGMAVTTSGNYERFVTIAGRRFAHIIDPVSGMPVEGMAAVTVISPTATEADALATALFVRGIDKAGAILQRFPNSSAMLIPDNDQLQIYVCPGFRSLFTPLPEYAGKIQALPAN